MGEVQFHTVRTGVVVSDDEVRPPAPKTVGAVLDLNGLLDRGQNVELDSGPVAGRLNLKDAARKVRGAINGTFFDIRHHAAAECEQVARALDSDQPLSGRQAIWLLNAMRERYRGTANEVEQQIRAVCGAVEQGRALSKAESEFARIALPELSRTEASAITLTPGGIPPNVMGIDTRHAEDLARCAKETGDVIMVAGSNASALRWHGDPNIAAKTRRLKAKAQRFGEFAGIVTNPRHPNIARQWNDAITDAKKQGDTTLVKEIRSAYHAALTAWDKHGESMYQSAYATDELGRVYRMRSDEDGTLRPTFFHSDYDLVGLWQHTDSEIYRLLSADGMPKDGEGLLGVLNRVVRPGTRMFQHGTFCDREYDDRRLVVPAVVFTPKGETIEILNVDRLIDLAKAGRMELPLLTHQG